MANVTEKESDGDKNRKGFFEVPVSTGDVCYGVSLVSCKYVFGALCGLRVHSFCMLVFVHLAFHFPSA